MPLGTVTPHSLGLSASCTLIQFSANLQLGKQQVRRLKYLGHYHPLTKLENNSSLLGIWRAEQVNRSLLALYL